MAGLTGSRVVGILCVVLGLMAEVVSAGPGITFRRFAGTTVKVVQQTTTGGGGQNVEVEAQANIVARGFGQYVTEGGIARVAASASLNTVAFLGGPVTLTTTGTTPLVYGTGNTSFRMTTFTTSPPSDFWRYYGMYGTGVRRHYTRLVLPGGLPGIDWGDGATSPVVQFSGSPTSVTSTPEGGVLQRWRGTFSHSYSDRIPHTVRVASGCCAATTVTTGNTVSAGSAGFTASYRSTIDLNGIRFTRYAHGTRTFGSTNTTLAGTSTESPYTLALTDPRSYVYQNSTPIVQITATAQVQQAIQSIPTASGYALGALALFLLGLGVVLLRRA